MIAADVVPARRGAVADLSPVRRVAWLGLVFALSATACAGDVGIREVADVGFVYPEVDATNDTVAEVGDAGTEGCVVTALDGCPAGRVCCSTPAERCVPSADGVNVCVPSGTTAVGDECGRSGVDDCQFGALCASATSGRERLVCRTLCPNGAADCDGGACSVELEVSGESIALCE